MYFRSTYITISLYANTVISISKYAFQACILQWEKIFAFKSKPLLCLHADSACELFFLLITGSYQFSRETKKKKIK